MNKLKEQLRLRMLGQLSDEKTEVDVNNAYDVAVDFAVSFLSFLRKNYSITYNNEFENNLSGDILDEKELLNKFLEEYESTK